MNTRSPLNKQETPSRSPRSFKALCQSVIAIMFMATLYSSLRNPLNLIDGGGHLDTAVRDDRPSNIPVFYNLFVKSQEDVQRVQNIVSEQFARLRPNLHHPVYVHSIGHHLPLPNTTLLEHHNEGFEEVTLHSLWDYCKFHTESKVVYLHSKGSYTATRRNDLLRRFVTTGALSEDCANLPLSCNVCSSRFSPMPHPHAPGNMFLARCDYVAKLINPNHFREAMAAIYGGGDNPCVGGGRFALEHWIHSHPTDKPCDLYTQPDYVWAYTHVPQLDNETERTRMALRPAPRFNQTSVYRRKICSDRGGSRTERLDEYERLYNETPGDDWWGWEFLPHDS
jgi:hypothetical protein